MCYYTVIIIYMPFIGLLYKWYMTYGILYTGIQKSVDMVIMELFLYGWIVNPAVRRGETPPIFMYTSSV